MSSDSSAGAPRAGGITTTSRRRHRNAEIGVVATLFVLVTAIHLSTFDQPLLEAHDFRQTQTAYTALLFHQDGISLLHPKLPVLGPPFEVPFEFPLFQAIASFVMDAGVSPDVAMRATGFTFFLLTGLLLYGFARRFAGRPEAVVTLFAFLFSSFALLWSRTSLIEYLATAAGVGFAWAAIEWRERRSGWLAVAALLSGSVACLVKVTTGALFVIPILAYVASREDRSLRGWARTRVDPVLLGICAIPLILAYVWTRHADSIKAASPYTGWLTSSRLQDWNLGTLDQRRQLSNWTTIFDRIVDRQFGGWVLLAVAVLGLVAARNRALWIGWALAGFAGVAIFFNLHLVHDYYQVATSPFVAPLVGLGTVAVVRRVERFGPGPIVVAALALSALWLAGIWGNRDDWRRAWNDNLEPPGRQLAAATSPDELVVVIGYDWSPTLLYYARRRGTMLKRGIPEIDAAVPSLPLTHRVLTSADPVNDELHLLRLWAWSAPVGPGIYRMSATRSDMPVTGIVGTTDRDAIAAARASGRSIAGARTLECGASSVRIPPTESDETWVELGDADDAGRVEVDGAASILPVVDAVVIQGSLPNGTVMRCSGTGSVPIVGIWRVPHQ